MYIEANPVIWSTNTMYFLRNNDCGTWIAERVAAQKALINSLHLEVILRYLGAGRFCSAAAHPVVKSLKGLKTLHLTLSDTFMQPRHFEESRLGNFQQLGLETVTVVMLDKGDIEMDRWMSQGLRRERIEFAEKARQELLA